MQSTAAYTPRIVRLVFLSMLTWLLPALLLGQSEDRMIESFGRKAGYQLGHVSAIVSDSTGALWLFGYKNRKFVDVFRSNELIIQRFDGTAFTTFPLDDLPSSLDFYHSPFYNTKEASVQVILSSHHSDSVYQYLLNPYSFEMRRYYKPVEGLDGMDRFMNHQDATGYYGTIRRGDSMFIAKWDASFEQKKELFLLVRDSTSTDVIQFYPSDRFVIWNEFRSGIFAVDTGLNKKRQLPYAELGFLPVSEHLHAIKRRFLINDTTYLLMLDQDKSIKRLRFDEARFDFVADDRTYVQHLLPDQLSSFERISGSNFFLDQSSNESVLWFQNNTEFSKRRELPVSIDGSTAFYHQDDDLIFFNRKNSLSFVDARTAGFTSILPELSVRSLVPIGEHELLISSEFNGFYYYNELTDSLAKLDLYQNDDIWSVEFVRNGFKEGNIIWSNDGVGVARIDLSTKQVESHRFYPIECMLNSRDYIYCGTAEFGLLRFDKQSRAYELIANLPNEWMLDLAYSSDSSKIISATESGLFVVNLIDGKTTKCNRESNPLNEGFMCLFRGTQGELLTGTNKGNIYQVDENTYEFTLVFSDSLQEPIASILEVGTGRYWFNSFNGIIEWDIHEGQLQRYNMEDGLSDNECNRYSALKRENGRIYVGTMAGLNIKIPSENQVVDLPEKVILVQASFYDEKSKKIKNRYAVEELKKLSEGIILPPDKGFLSLRFRLASYRDVRYANLEFRLNNGEWYRINERSQIELLDLGPGQYSIDVRAINSLGLQIGEIVSYKVIVKKFLYQQWWMWLLLTFLVATISYYLILKARQEGRLQRQFTRNLLEYGEQQRQQISRDIHDAAGQDLILLSQRLDLKEDSQSSGIARKVLNELRGISHNLHPFVLDKYGLTMALKMQLHRLEEQTELFVTEEIDEIDQLFEKSQELHIYRLVQESIANVLKHAQATAFTIEVSKKEKEVTLWLEDNGKGFKGNSTFDRSDRMGLRTIKERVNILNGKLEIKKGEMGGVVLSIVIPIPAAAETGI